MKAVVVGAGVVGASVAFNLAARGVDVTVLEANRPATGATGASFAWLNSNAKPPVEYHMLNMIAMGEHESLAKRLGGRDWLFRCGNLEVGATADAVERVLGKVAALEASGYPVHLVDLADLSRLEPALVVKPEYEIAAFYPSEGYADAVLLTMRLLDAAAAKGATIRGGAKVTGFVIEGKGVTGVRLGDETVDADVVVVTAGPSVGELFEQVDVPITTRGKAGMQITTAPGVSSLSTVLHIPGLSVRPDAAGRVILRSKAADDQIDQETWTLPDDAVRGLLDAGAAALTGVVGELVAERMRFAHRPVPADGLPAVGPVGPDGLYLVSTHSGVTLGPLLGRLAATEVTGGGAPAILEHFRPQRLLEGVPA
jgi:glycine/D-amino acid oxidase-like deaminating enzyme